MHNVCLCLFETSQESILGLNAMVSFVNVLFKGDEAGRWDPLKQTESGVVDLLKHLVVFENILHGVLLSSCFALFE